MHARPIALFAVSAAFALGAHTLAQPSLSPPAGPVDETGRFGTLIELTQETAPGDAQALFIITEPGSYVLTKDSEADERIGILVEADDVTVDLNGYTLRGVGEVGVSVPPALTEDRTVQRLVVRNGKIVGFDAGVDGERAFTGPDSVVRRSRFDHPLLEGLHIEATGRGVDLVTGRIESCTVVALEIGIVAVNATVRSCEVVMRGVSEALQSTGVSGNDATIVDVHVDVTQAFTGENQVGISAFDSLVRGCHARSNDIGFLLSGVTLATECFSNAPSNVLNDSPQVIDSNF